jgi:NOL1/NOP2/fmu family ribosome biogenesis protein
MLDKMLGVEENLRKQDYKQKKKDCVASSIGIQDGTLQKHRFRWKISKQIPRKVPLHFQAFSLVQWW